MWSARVRSGPPFSTAWVCRPSNCSKPRTGSPRSSRSNASEPQKSLQAPCFTSARRNPRLFWGASSLWTAECSCHNAKTKEIALFGFWCFLRLGLLVLQNEDDFPVFFLAAAFHDVYVNPAGNPVSMIVPQVEEDVVSIRGIECL